jgi:hypothetical protein
MNVPRQTGEIFEILSKGQFICSNSSDIRISKLFDIIDDKENYESLREYLLNINFILEKGDEFYFLSRRNESKADIERKLEASMKWIDIVDFLKTFDNSFGSGFSFSPSSVAVNITVDAVLKDKAEGLRNLLKIEEKTSYPDLVSKIADLLCKDGFMEVENEIMNSYKVLASFKFLEELINIINIRDENEIPE